MSFEYLEIKDKLFIPECVSVHKRIFRLTDADSFPALFFNMLIRQEHPLGIIVGCFKKEDNKLELIGITVTISDIDQSLYCVFMGFIPEYQNGRHGFIIAAKLREIALSRGFSKLYGIYDPLEANLGRLYSFLGCKTTRYIHEPYAINNIDTGIDKVLFEWQLDSEHVKNVYGGGIHTNVSKSIDGISVVCSIDTNEPEVLVEIPNNYHQLKSTNSEEAARWRENTRTLLSEYLNNRGYFIDECRSIIINNSKRTYYLLSNKAKVNLFNNAVFSNN